jgi:guanylate kinase
VTRKSPLLLVMGPSGVGKTTTIRALTKLDPRFRYIQPYTTRELRTGERDKISVSSATFERMARDGNFLVVNFLYGARYGAPKEIVADSFARGEYPVIDWPIEKAELITQKVGGGVYGVYLVPPCLDVLRVRLSDGRDPSQDRMSAAVREIERVDRGEYDSMINQKIITTNNEVGSVALNIRNGFLESLKAASAAAQEFSGPRFKLKNDRHRHVRGGTARMMEITCANCGAFMLLYQKDGKGHLLRCYLNRIFAPCSFAALQANPAIVAPTDLSVLVCPSCRAAVGTPIRHTDGRLAFSLRPGHFRARYATNRSAGG